MEQNNELKFIFANINEWLKFAEAKHAGLVVFNSGLIIAILANITALKPFVYKETIIIGIICFGISILLSILSQFPLTQNFFKDIKNIENPNLLFFGSLSHLNNEAFIKEYKKENEAFKLTSMNNNLINQILINSRITSSKFSLFKYSSFLTAFGTCFIALFSIIKYILHVTSN